MNKLQVLKSCVESNMSMILVLTEKENILDRTIPDSFGYHMVNPDNVELRQRIKLLRKELAQLDKELMKDNRKWGKCNEA